MNPSATLSKSSAVLIGLLLAPTLVAAQPSVVGDWNGTLEPPGATLPIVFHIRDTDGTLTATLDSPAQGASGIPVSRVAFEGSLLELEVAVANGSYKGELQEDGTVVGTWSQGGASLPLVLTRGDGVTTDSMPKMESTQAFDHELSDAVLAGDVDKVRALVEGGADIHALDTRPDIAGRNGRRPLNFAALRNDTEMIEALLELGADINRQNLSGFTPLHHAVEAQSEAAIELLLERGADTTVKNRRNLTPYEMAEQFGLTRAAAALEKGTGDSPAVTPPSPENAPIVGHWHGTLEVGGGMELPVIFHIRDSDGSLKATLDSPNQGANGIPVATVTFEAPRVELELPVVNGHFEGELEDVDTIHGTWSQNGMSFDLVLERGEESVALPNRPQEPKAPFPYKTEEVRVASAGKGVTLAGTLTLPDSQAPSPAAILISGSGAQNRDEELMGHKPFLVLADHLTRNGIAVLRMDDRGVGESSGIFAVATSADFADDVLGAVEFLDERADIGPIGLIGHSEGGLIAPMVANRSPKVRFVVLMAGPGVIGEEILYAQAELLIKASGGTDMMAAANRSNQEAIFAIVREEEDPAKRRDRLQTAILEALSAQGLSSEAREAQARAQLTQLMTPWFRYFLTYDPKPALEKLECPVLAIIGEKDLQVPAKENLEAIESALARGGNADFEVKELPSLNHLFQTAETGSMGEYAQIEETMAPLTLETMAQWIVEHVGASH